MTTPACACKAVNLAFGGCVGQYRECTVRCSAIARVEVNRGARQMTCLERTIVPDDTETRPC